MKLIRVLRGILGTAAAWSLAWVPLTLATWAIAGLLGGHVPGVRYLGIILISAAIRGAISGAAFATVLAIAGRRRTFASLRLLDMLKWGAVGGVVAPAISFAAMSLSNSVPVPPLAMGLSLGWASMLGALSAAGTLWIARRAPVSAPMNLDGASEPDDPITSHTDGEALPAEALAPLVSTVRPQSVPLSRASFNPQRPDLG